MKRLFSTILLLLAFGAAQAQSSSIITDRFMSVITVQEEMDLIQESFEEEGATVERLEPDTIFITFQSRYTHIMVWKRSGDVVSHRFIIGPYTVDSGSSDWENFKSYLKHLGFKIIGQL